MNSTSSSCCCRRRPPSTPGVSQLAPGRQVERPSQLVRGGGHQAPTCSRSRRPGDPAQDDGALAAAAAAGAALEAEAVPVQGAVAPQVRQAPGVQEARRGAAGDGEAPVLQVQPDLAVRPWRGGRLGLLRRLQQVRGVVAALLELAAQADLR